MEKRAQITPLDRINQFNEQVVIPAFEEMTTTLENHNILATLFETEPDWDEQYMQLFGLLHPEPRYISELLTRTPAQDEINQGLARYIGHSYIVEEMSVSYNSEYAGFFLESLEFTLGSAGRIYAAPQVIYHMRFNDKFHLFQHRFREEVEFLEIEKINRYDIQNHFLNSFNYYQIHAGDETCPW